MGVQKGKKQSKRALRYKNISEDKPLTVRERKFCELYIKGVNATQAYIQAGFSAKNAAMYSHDLIHNKPNTRKYISEKLNRHFERLEFDAFDVLKKLGDIAMCPVDELVPIEEGFPVVKNTDDLSERARNLYAGASVSFSQTGDKVVNVSAHNQLEALKLLCKYYGILDSTRRAPAEPITEQKEAIRAVREGEKTVVEACLDLEYKGVPIPETLKILLSKNAEQEDDSEGDIDLPTPEEMDKKMQERMKEIEGQRETFVPKRQEEVRQIKAELSGKDQWKESQKIINKSSDKKQILRGDFWLQN